MKSLQRFRVMFICALNLYQQSSIMKLGVALWNRLLHSYHTTLTIKYQTQLKENFNTENRKYNLQLKIEMGIF